MKILCLYDNDEPENQFIEILEELKLEVKSFSMQGKWEENKEFIKLISKNDYFLVYTTSDIILSSWIKFLSGYCMGSERCLYLHFFKEKIHLPAYLNFAKKGDNLVSLKNFFAKENKQWKKNTVIQCAKDELKRIGMFFSLFNFFYCIKENRTDSVELFLVADMHPDVKDERGVTCLCHAVRLNNNIIAKLIIEEGCDINIRSSDNNNNALMDAAANNNTEMFKLLLELGSELNVQSKNEQTALMLAVGRGNVINTKLLLEAGADAEVKDVLGMTAMRYAKILKYKNITNLFEELLTAIKKS